MCRSASNLNVTERDLEQSGVKSDDEKFAKNDIVDASEQRHLTPNVTIQGVVEGDIGGSNLNKKDAETKSPKLGSPKSSRHNPSTSGSSGSGGSSSNHLGVNNNTRNRRRSSVVVIPPMQICPGDLLVYSKVLSQRSNMIGQCERK